MNLKSDLDQKIISYFTQALLSLNRNQVKNILIGLIGSEHEYSKVESIITQSFHEIGLGWENGTIALSQVYMSGRICEEILEQILPKDRDKTKSQYRIGIVVLEDFHLLGKKMVLSLLKAAGFNPIDYGHGISVDEVVERVKSDKLDILMVSTLMLRSALRIQDLKEKLANISKPVIIIAGGAPFNFDSSLAEEVGVKYVAKNASEGIEILRSLIK